MAAGLTVRPSAVPELRAFLCARLAEESAQAQAEEALEIDVLTAPGAARGLLDEFEALAPFGPGNPEPRFALAGVRVDAGRRVGTDHVACALVDTTGRSLRAIAWRCADAPLGRRLLAGGAALHVAGVLRPDDWKGPGGVQLEIEDAADPRRA